MRVSGHPKVQATFARVMGYVEQTDIHSPNVSCRCSLKQPAVPLLHTQSASCAVLWSCSASVPVPCCCLEPGSETEKMLAAAHCLMLIAPSSEKPYHRIHLSPRLTVQKLALHLSEHTHHYTRSCIIPVMFAIYKQLSIQKIRSLLIASTVCFLLT